MLGLGVGFGLRLGHCEGDQGPTELAQIRRVPTDRPDATASALRAWAVLLVAHRVINLLPAPAIAPAFTQEARLLPVNAAQMQHVNNSGKIHNSEWNERDIGYQRPR